MAQKTRSVASTPVVHVVDDDAATRSALSRILRGAGYDVRAHASAVDFMGARPGDRPGCALVDVDPTGSDGPSLREALRHWQDPLPLILVQAAGAAPARRRLPCASAIGRLTKPVQREALLGAVRSAIAWDAERRVAGGRSQVLRARYASLTPRERQVFERVVAGRLNRQIAAELGAAQRTIKVHRARVMVKMQVASRVELVRLAAELRACAAARKRDSTRSGRVS